MSEQPLDIEAIEDVLRQSVGAMKAHGIEVGPGAFGVMHGGIGAWIRSGKETVCLIGAYLLATQPKMSGGASETCQLSLGISTGQVWSLITGYDGGSQAPYHDGPYYALGRHFREEWEASVVEAKP